MTKGVWIPTGNVEEWYGEEMRCSVCGVKTLDDGNYCPNCGAEMEQDEQE